MKAFVQAFAALILLLALAAGAAAFLITRNGLSTRQEPSRIEALVARAARRLATPREMRGRANPLEATDAVRNEGLEHFAHHCASCHGNEGSGDTELGRGLFPKPPDMRLPRTQNLTDGELFLIIENGVRFTGMPAFGSGNPIPESSTWPLVHFIRHLPNLTAEEIAEMEGLNPASPDEIRQRILEEQFLQGGGAAPPPHDAPHPHKGGHQ